ncbi:hypothetical protein ABEO98_24595 [Brevibacillus parabrevis]|uniref:hypothetical protein n=1 Tax=Brevibacillus parabrevis TaxID=54914 RepID=UPI002E1F2BDA|nr:hypothetical protein [Brevibacillus parabrevis]
MQSLAVIVLHFFLTTLLVYGLLRLVAGRLGWRDDALKWNVLAATLANVGYFGLAGLACPDRLAARHVDERFAMIILLTTVISPFTPGHGCFRQKRTARAASES